MFTIGTDPEFIINDEINFISAIKKFPCQQRAIKKNKNKFYYDNVLVEIQIKEAKSKKEFVSNIGTAICDLVDLSKPYSVSNCSFAEFPQSELTHPDSRSIGCNPEYCAYDLKMIEQPLNVIKTTGLRSAGGHIHLGAKFLYENSYDVIHTVRLLDLFLGIPSIFLDKTDGCERRKTIYGKAGSHRLTDYGLEYRTLSNFWLFSPELCFYVYETCEFVLEFVHQKKYTQLWTLDEKSLLNGNPSKAFKTQNFDVVKLRKCLNSNDKKTGKEFLKIIKSFLPNHLYNNINELCNIKYDIKSNWI